MMYKLYQLTGNGWLCTENNSDPFKLKTLPVCKSWYIESPNGDIWFDSDDEEDC